MAETCGTCKHTDPGCLIRIRGEQGLDCYYYEARETPLLVDVLAETLKNVWAGRFTDGGGDCGCERPGYTVLLTPEQCEIIQAALNRYKEEVGDT